MFENMYEFSYILEIGKEYKHIQYVYCTNKQQTPIVSYIVEVIFTEIKIWLIDYSVVV